MGRRPVRGMAFLALLLGALPGRAVQPETVGARLPATLESASARDAYPIWVAADAISDDFSEIEPHRRAYLLESARSQHSEPGDCIPFVPNVIDPRYPKPRAGVADLVLYSWDILAGSVIAREHGFYRGEPGVMLVLDIEESLKQSDYYLSGRPVRLFLRATTQFVAGGRRICQQNSDWPWPAPGVGDRILVFPYYEPVDAQRSVLFPIHEGVFIERAGSSKLLMPISWRERVEQHAVERFDDLRTVARHLHEREKGVAR